MKEEEGENGGSGGAGTGVEEVWVCVMGEEEFDEGFVAEEKSICNR